ncbi:MAG: isochorismatase family cysteine hydrolase, partial [bacterium]
KLDATLQDLGVNHIVLTGVVSNICIMYTAVDAHQRGYRVSVPEDCVAGLDPDDHAFALRQITDVLKFART